MQLRRISLYHTWQSVDAMVSDKSAQKLQGQTFFCRQVRQLIRVNAAESSNENLTVKLPFPRYVLAVNTEDCIQPRRTKPIATKPRILPINGRAAIKSIHDRVACTTNVGWLAPPARFITLVFKHELCFLLSTRVRRQVRNRFIVWYVSMTDQSTPFSFASR